MIKVKRTKNSLTITGHAGFADYGKDIVCASVSTMITTSVNDMFVVNKDAFTYSDDGKKLIIKIIKEDDLINKLFDNLFNLLKSLEKDYKENIKIESEE
ncbi:MAG TPA: ribosomal-processing cysteine protease Prp [Mollicutes bacterium]|nr:ribosomal-processing cysteine protease Prp [Mollicutes bacterium]